MSDITKCRGTNCPIKEHCKRYTAKANDQWQAYFTEVPFKIEDDKLSCDMFWGQSQDNILQQLKDITGYEGNIGI
jgi:hypothetical protein